jgi:SAM-dependent methyltransferase
LLDLGAGEGFVGAAATRGSGSEVALADVVDLNRTALPLTLYDGHRLPFADGSFDAVLLVFVLHHCETPDDVLREARRVTRGRVAVLESVVEDGWDRAWLTFADTAANRIRSGGRMPEERLDFDTVEGWWGRFEAAGFKVVAEERRGRWLHKRHLFVLEPR